MANRSDCADRLIHAPAERLYRAFSEPGAMQRWLPPSGMRGEMLHFDFREGGSYRMRLVYAAGAGQGKTTSDADEVQVRLVRLEPPRLIEQEVEFDSPDLAFANTMRMRWTFEPEGEATRVTVRATHVPAGISQADHETGLLDSLANLARFTENPG